MPDNDVPKIQDQVTELKVSGHMMALDPGVYCVFSAPGSVAPARDTGLPTVRIGAAPGQPDGQVEVVGLHANGWVGPDSATLIRIADRRSSVLVTVYQAKGTRAEAPQIQVVRISGEQARLPVAEAPAPSPASLPAPGQPLPPQDAPMFAHIYGKGDVGGELGAWMGERGSKRWIEGFAVGPVGDVPASDIEYQAVLGRGWLSPWSEGGQFCGSRSMALPILGLRVRLRGASAKTHRIVLAATFVDGSAVGPVTDGEPCEAASLAALEAFHLAFEPAALGAGTAADAKPARRGVTKAAAAPEPMAAKDAAGKTGGSAGGKAGSRRPEASPTMAKAKALATKAAMPEPARSGKAVPKPAAAVAGPSPTPSRAQRTPAPPRRR